MSCGCIKPDTTSLWTPIPEYRQPTDIQRGENIDCYAKRAGSQSGLKNDVAEQIPNRIENTSLTSDLNLNVDTQFKLTDTSTRVATEWSATINSQPLTDVLPELQFDISTGKLSGTVSQEHANKNYKVLIAAIDGEGEIDSREFNFYPKQGSKDDTIKFIFPLPGGVVTCKFGPRNPPAAGASSMHKGIDCALPGRKITDIVAAADGTVVKCGPARGFGNWVVIEHRNAGGNLVATTVYGHMSKIYVAVGQKVSAGQKIALEGNEGIGSGAHLHFEIHKGSWGNPVDPMPYLNGTFEAASDNIPGQSGEPVESSKKTVTNSNVGMTNGEATAGNDCPALIPNQPQVTSPEPEAMPDPPSGHNNVTKNRSACAPENDVPNTDFVLAEIRRACNEDPELNADDKKFIEVVAKIESSFDPYAKNPTSSATGLYQMLDSIATKYYGLIGVSPTCANRCNPYYATKAMIKFYKNELKNYWTGFVNSGKTKIANKPIKDTPHSARYASLTQGEFMYGLVHHDGVGNAVNGIDKQGIAYYQSKVRSS